jgi:hypothetical protein
MNKKYISLMKSLTAEQREEAENLLLEMLCRFEPAYVGTTDKQDDKYAGSIRAAKNFVLINRHGYLVPKARNVFPFFREDFTKRGRPWQAQGHSLLARRCLQEIRHAQDNPKIWERLAAGDKSVQPLGYAVRYWMDHVRLAWGETRDHSSLVLSALGSQTSFDHWREAYARSSSSSKKLTKSRSTVLWMSLSSASSPKETSSFARFDGPPNSLLEVLLSAGLVLLARKLLNLEPPPSWWHRESWWPLSLSPPGPDTDTLTKERLYYAVANSNSLPLYAALRARIGPPAMRPVRYGALARAALAGSYDVMDALLQDSVDMEWPGSATRAEGQPEFLPNHGFLPSPQRLMRAVRPHKQLADDADYESDLYCDGGNDDDDENDDKLEEESLDPRDAWRIHTPVTPLAVAIVRDDAQALMVLKRHGLQLDWEKRLDRAISLACSPKRVTNIAGYLIGVCAQEVWVDDAQTRARKLFSLLRAAVSSQALELVNVTLSCGADPNFEPKDERGRLVSTPLNDAVRLMQRAVDCCESDDGDKSLRQMVNESGRMVWRLIEAGAKLDMYTRAFIRDHRHLQLIFEGYEHGKGWERILDDIDKEFLDETWVVVKKSTVRNKREYSLMR